MPEKQYLGWTPRTGILKKANNDEKFVQELRASDLSDAEVEKQLAAPPKNKRNKRKSELKNKLSSSKADNNADEDESKQDKAIASEPETENAVEQAQERAQEELPDFPELGDINEPELKSEPLEQMIEHPMGLDDDEDGALPTAPLTSPTPPTPPIGTTSTAPSTSSSSIPSTSPTSSIPPSPPTTKPPSPPTTTPPPPPSPPPPNKHSKRIPDWAIHNLTGRLDESVGSDLGLISRLIGKIMGGGSRALGNIGAVLDTTGGQQAAVYGNPMAGAGALTKGLGEFGGVAGDALGETMGGILEDSGAAYGNWRQDYAAHLELQHLQDELYQRLHDYVEDLNNQGVDVNRAGVFDVLKNIANTMGNAFISNSRNRMVTAGRSRRR
jgi:hypothetical protein